MVTSSQLHQRMGGERDLTPRNMKKRSPKPFLHKPYLVSQVFVKSIVEKWYEKGYGGTQCSFN